ncbi:unnamed protein product [Cuscuta campestris]|uniref:Uncharacterized protein n=1 Tax=Cuscuta campestris TaxID=132261 RepID=A0A484KP64_9ASTE|nr:unnamed protein product [Cuscuta campestris]
MRTLPLGRAIICPQEDGVRALEDGGGDLMGRMLTISGTMCKLSPHYDLPCEHILHIIQAQKFVHKLRGKGIILPSHKYLLKILINRGYKVLIQTAVEFTHNLFDIGPLQEAALKLDGRSGSALDGSSRAAAHQLGRQSPWTGGGSTATGSAAAPSRGGDNLRQVTLAVARLDGDCSTRGDCGG